jgi:hypothetical protein
MRVGGRVMAIESLEVRVEKLSEDLTKVEEAVKELEGRVGGLETGQKVHGIKIENAEKELKKIADNTTWLLRIVISAIILYILKDLFEKSQTAAETLSKLLGSIL